MINTYSNEVKNRHVQFCNLTSSGIARKFLWLLIGNVWGNFSVNHQKIQTNYFEIVLAGQVTSTTTEPNFKCLCNSTFELLNVLEDPA